MLRYSNPTSGVQLEELYVLRSSFPTAYRPLETATMTIVTTQSPPEVIAARFDRAEAELAARRRTLAKPPAAQEQAGSCSNQFTYIKGESEAAVKVVFD
jgi:hypothetical protein